MPIIIHTHETLFDGMRVTHDPITKQITFDTRSDAEITAEQQRVAANQAKNRVVVMRRRAAQEVLARLQQKPRRRK
jgi:hypothetical protein